jgi:class 3 adenylate cyclase
MTTVGLACGSCGTDLRENAKFCDECGAPTAGSRDTAKYKQVTVLFADVVRSMDIAATVDMERLREIMTEVVERSATVARRYGGTVDYTGDGVMALFGAPIALEDHAFRACLAALAIQNEANRLAAEVQQRDGLDLRLRIGLDSGRVIAGEIGSGSLRYAATGEHVGMAQRMEAAAPPGAVMLTESTAQLVEHVAELAEPELVHIKGADKPVRARQLLAVRPRDGLVGRGEASLVGRQWEMATLDANVDRAVAGRGGVVNVVGPPGIGKSRVARETAALAADRGVEVFWAFCESHARDISFGVVARLLCATLGVAGHDRNTARARVRVQVPHAAAEDLLLLDDLLGIADPDLARPQIDPDARRRRLTALVNSASLARTQPTLFVIEDAHWIDAVSESMLADFVAVIPRTPSMVLITYRPEYEGALTRTHGAQTIALAPLDDSDTTALLGQLLGSNPSVGELAAIIAERAAGNPFFTEEIVRELVQRGVLTGERGNYLCHSDAADVAVPATVQSAIEARIDRLSAAAKQTLNAAAVIGARFDAGLFAALGIEPAVDELVATELIDQVRFTPSAEYAFRHPLIRAVAYESQLKSDRAQRHRRLAAAIQESDSASVEENAALIAEHLEAGGELRAAYDWHMRAGAWSANRDLGAARLSWERARRIADQLPDDGAQRSMRIGPRAMLCATAWEGRKSHETPVLFAELRELCTAAEDKVSLAIGMSGLAIELLYEGRSREAAQLASEQMALLESIGDPTPVMGLAFVAFCGWFTVGEFGEILRWSESIIDLAGGDPTKGAGFGVESPLAIALVFRGVAGWWLGRAGWRQDLHDAVAMARRSNPATLAAVLTWTYSLAMYHGVLRADDSAVRAIEEAVQTAEVTNDNTVLGLITYTLGVALLCREPAADRHRGMELMAQSQDAFVSYRFFAMVPITELWAAREKASQGDLDNAIPVMREVADGMGQAGQVTFCVWAAGVLVETLLKRGATGDVAEAQQTIDRLSNLQAEQRSATLEITLLRLRALLARAQGDNVVYRDLVGRYRAIAESLGFEGHIAWAEAM